MSESHQSELHSEPHSEPWIETWWPFLVIAFGLIFVSCLVFFKPIV